MQSIHISTLCDASNSVLLTSSVTQSIRRAYFCAMMHSVSLLFVMLAIRLLYLFVMQSIHRLLLCSDVGMGALFYDFLLFFISAIGLNCTVKACYNEDGLMDLLFLGIVM